MTLSDLHKRYTAAADKKTLDKERQKALQKFQIFVIASGFVKTKGLKFGPDGISLNQGGENLRKFHYALLGFLLKNVREGNADKEPYLSIRIYFDLQTERGVLVFKEGVTSYNPSSFAFVEKYSFAHWTSNLQKFLDVEHARLRDPSRLHHRFLRFNTKLKPASASETIYQEIKKRTDKITYEEWKRPIKIDGFSARSVIMALHRAMPEIMAKLSPAAGAAPFSGKPFYFQIGETLIKWLPTPVKQHGRVFIEMEYWNASKTRLVNSRYSIRPDRDLLHKFPYDEVAPRLLALEEKLVGDPKNLMALILRKFSSRIEPFAAAEFTSIDSEELHFLNAFSFLTQIAENARYLNDGVGERRDIEGEPLSIVMAVTKALKREGKLNWKELYTDAPTEFKKEKIPFEWHRFAGGHFRPAPGDHTSIRGLDPTSGKDLTLNYKLIKEKIAELSKRYPGHLHGVLSASSVASLFRDSYGDGSESDSDGSVYSLSESFLDPDYLTSNKKAIEASLKAWAAKPRTKRLTSLEELAAENGFDHVDAGGEGNCFFHAVVHQLNELGINEEDYDHRELRAAAVNYVLDNWIKFMEVIDDPADFVERMATTGEWADHEIIVATAFMLKVNIRIYRDDGADSTFIDIEEHGDVAVGEINLGYYVDAHYVSFVPHGLEYDEAHSHTSSP